MDKLGDKDFWMLLGGTVVRHAANWIGATLFADGLASKDQANQIAGGAIALIAVGWSFWQKYGHSMLMDELKKYKKP